MRIQVIGLAVVLNSWSVAGAITLNGPGTATTLSGSLGNVEVVANADDPMISGALTNSGLVSSGLAIDTTRVQYDILNTVGNESIFEVRVDYPVGTTVLAAANPGAFRQADGTLQTYWAGSIYATLLDSGLGLYTDDRDNHGSEWIIDYQSDHLLWRHVGNGFFANTATGRTDVGTALPTFAIFFERGTPLGLQPTIVAGFSTQSAGRAYSAVPEPGASVLLLFGLITLTSRRTRSVSL